MKQYLIDGLQPADYHKIKEYLDQNLSASPIGGVYWLKIDPDLLTSVQQSHRECQPHVFGLELQEASLSCEFLVRIQKNIKCDCMEYATPEQWTWLINTVDAILEKLDIRI